MNIPLVFCLSTLALVGHLSAQDVKSPIKSASQSDFISPVAKHRQSWGVKSHEAHLQVPVFKQSSALIGGNDHGYSLTIDHGLSKEPVPLKSAQMTTGHLDSQIVSSGEHVQPWTYSSGDLGATKWVKESTYAVKQQPKAIFAHQQVHSYSPMLYSTMKHSQPWIYTMPPMPMHLMPMAKHVQIAQYAPLPAPLGPLTMPLAAPLAAHLPEFGLHKHQVIKYDLPVEGLYKINPQPWSYSTFTHQPEMQVSKVVKSQVATSGWSAPLPQVPELDAQVNMKFDRYGATGSVANVDAQNTVRVDKSFDGITQEKM